MTWHDIFRKSAESAKEVKTDPIVNAPFRPWSGIRNTLGMLLADVAIRVQLSQAAHRRAVKRYEEIREWIERDGR